MDLLFFNEKFPIIQLEDIVLREISPNDAPKYFEFMSSDTMRPFVTEDNIPISVSQSSEELKYWGGLFKSKRSIYWAIALKENNSLIGTAGFNFISMRNSRADISYDLDPKYWGKGIMSKSIRAILSFAEETMKLVRIQANVIIDNDRSIKLLEHCGFEKDGFMKKYEIVDGKHRDYYLYSIVFG
jgi:ribosomal-protein-alanine N-acetyltransferase